MDWYWWVLISVGVISIVVLKVIYAPKYLKAKKEKQEQLKKKMEE